MAGTEMWGGKSRIEARRLHGPLAAPIQVLDMRKDEGELCVGTKKN